MAIEDPEPSTGLNYFTKWVDTTVTQNTYITPNASGSISFTSTSLQTAMVPYATTTFTVHPLTYTTLAETFPVVFPVEEIPPLVINEEPEIDDLWDC